MLDFLVIIVDQFADSERFGPFEKMASLFSRQEYCILRLRSLESTVVRVVLILQHLSNSSTENLRGSIASECFFV